jgi:hypothetical protein
VFQILIVCGCEFNFIGSDPGSRNERKCGNEGAYLYELFDLPPVGGSDGSLAHSLLHPREDFEDALVHGVLAQLVRPAAEILGQFPAKRGMEKLRSHYQGLKEKNASTVHGIHCVPRVCSHKIRIRHFMRIRIWMQGFDDQKLGKIQLKKLSFFDKKIAIYLSLGLHKGHPNYRRNRQPSKDNIQCFSAT